MANGIKHGCDGAQLMTFHPRGGSCSSTWFHSEDWLDFNMYQSGHSKMNAVYRFANAAYLLRPTKPFVDGEPAYEEHCVRGFGTTWTFRKRVASVFRLASWTMMVCSKTRTSLIKGTFQPTTFGCMPTGIFCRVLLAIRTAITPFGRCFGEAMTRPFPQR